MRSHDFSDSALLICRNNLYWSESLQTACMLWGTASDPSTSIRVLLISASSTDFDKGSATISDVLKSELRPLDEEHIQGIENKDTANFVGAIYDFAEWDDFQRVSFQWPNFLLRLLENPAKCYTWRTLARGHELAEMFPSEMHLYLFFMCAEHTGLISLLSPIRRAGGSVEREPRVASLVDCIVFMQSNEDIDFRRKFSRCGDDYQTIVPDYSPNRARSPDPCDEPLFVPGHLTDCEYSEYLRKAKAATANDFVQSGALVETVRNMSLVQNAAELVSDEDWSRLRRRKGALMCVVTQVESGGYKRPAATDTPAADAAAHSSEAVQTPLPPLITGLVARSGSLDLTEEPLRYPSADTAEGDRLPSAGPLSAEREAAGTPLPKIWTADESTDPSALSALASSATPSSAGPAPTICDYSKCRVFDGVQRWSVPASLIRALGGDLEPRFLALLHECNYNTAEALLRAKYALVSPCPHHSSSLRINPADFDIVLALCEKRGDNLQDVMTSLTKRLPAAPMIVDGSSSNAMTMKKLVSMYFLRYAEKERDENKSGDSGGGGYGGGLMSGAGGGSGSRMRYRLDDDEAFRAAAASEQRRRSSKGAKDGRPATVFNRWPAGLPVTSHNLYWIRNSETPCVCLGLELPPAAAGASSAQGVTLKVFPIYCNSFHRVNTVRPNELLPLTRQLLSTCVDVSTRDFVLAMMTFAEWEQQTNLSSSEEPQQHRWYTYPSFIMELIARPSEWSGWRKQALRANKGRSGVSKDTLLFEALVEDFTNVHKLNDTERCTDGEVPWDDTPLYDSSDTDSDSSEDISAAPAPGESGAAGPREEQEQEPAVSSVPEDTVVVPETPLVVKKKAPKIVFKPVNYTNLYWLDRHNLPCIRLTEVDVTSDSGNEEGSAAPASGDPEGDYEEQIFKGQPVCCATYHYPVFVTVKMASEVKFFDINNLKFCNDERTQDFTKALVMFHSWDSKRCVAAAAAAEPAACTSGESSDFNPATSDSTTIDGEHSPSGAAVVSVPPRRYAWPQFILDLISRPRDWAAWRKKCERLSRGREGRVEQYLRALVEERQRTVGGGEVDIAAIFAEFAASNESRKRGSSATGEESSRSKKRAKKGGDESKVSTSSPNDATDMFSREGKSTLCIFLFRAQYASFLLHQFRVDFLLSQESPVLRPVASRQVFISLIDCIQRKAANFQIRFRQASNRCASISARHVQRRFLHNVLFSRKR
jgi:hypothetical protein